MCAPRAPITKRKLAKYRDSLVLWIAHMQPKSPFLRSSCASRQISRHLAKYRDLIPFAFALTRS